MSRWKAGSILFDAIIETLNDNEVEDHIRKSIYYDLIPVFEEEDCELDDSLGTDKVFDAVWNELNDDEEDEEEKDDGEIE